MATMRSKYVPEEGKFHTYNRKFIFHFLARATIMNYFRIPLNLIVVVILLKVRRKNIDFHKVFLSFRTFH